MADLSATIDTDGVTGDYSSLSAGNAGESQDLTDGGGDTFTFNCQATTGVVDSTGAIIAGWVTASGNDLTFAVSAGQEAVKTNWDTNIYRLEVANTNALDIREDFINVLNMQIGKSASDNHGQSCIYFSNIGATNSLYVSDCRLKQAGDNTQNEPNISILDSDCDVVIENTLMYNAGTRDSDNNSCILSGGDVVLIYNCTIYDGNRSLNHSGTTTTIKNSICGNVADVGGPFVGGPTIDYCCSDDGSGTNAQSPSGASWANELNNAGIGDFTLLAGGNCQNGGVGPGTDANVPTTDIDGTSRAGATCDIGADELAAAGGLGIPIVMHHRRQMH